MVVNSLTIYIGHLFYHFMNYYLNAKPLLMMTKQHLPTFPEHEIVKQVFLILQKIPSQISCAKGSERKEPCFGTEEQVFALNPELYCLFCVLPFEVKKQNGVSIVKLLNY